MERSAREGETKQEAGRRGSGSRLSLTSKRDVQAVASFCIMFKGRCRSRSNAITVVLVLTPDKPKADTEFEI